MAATAVVEYVVGDESTIVFTLRQAGGRPRITARVLPIGRKALAARVEAFCHAIESRDLGYARDARRLETTLLEPLLPTLHGVSTLAIVPDAELWRLPFQALVTPDGRFLIQRFGIFYTPSLSMLREAHAARSTLARQPTLLAFGNPVVSGAEAARLRDVGYDGDIRPLPDAEREVHAIAALYGGRSRVYIKGEASENAFKHDAPQYDILHLATHGFLDDHSPMYSALLFAAPPGDPTEDGLLETREILHMHLHARMAVLAACDTGRGTAGPGEGVIGISWAFLMAGCPTTVVTQWKASSTAASILMVDFHRHLRNGAGKADALRLAQVAMLHDRAMRHPFYWASFVMVGAP
jgi:CHAT domain-containing protein